MVSSYLAFVRDSCGSLPAWITTCANRDGEGLAVRAIGAVGDGLQAGEIQLGQSFGDGAQQCRAGAEVERRGAVGHNGFAVHLQMAQPFGPVVSQQLDRRIT